MGHREGNQKGGRARREVGNKSKCKDLSVTRLARLAVTCCLVLSV
jgi:hypothetical protein